MHIHQVVSYLGAWNKINREHQAELSEILVASNNYFSGKVKIDDKDDRGMGSLPHRYWDKALFDLGWTLNDQTYYSPTGKRVHLGSLGPTKNGISVQLNIGNPSLGDDVRPAD